MRARIRRIAMNVSVDEMAQRIGVSSKTLGNFERSGRCTLETFLRILDTFNASSDMQSVLLTQTRTIEEMRLKVASSTRKRASRKRSVRIDPT